MNFDSSVLEAALSGLSSCVRCRSRRTGCDQTLPSCGPCMAAGAECELYDYILETSFPRSYLQALHQRLQHLDMLLAPSSNCLPKEMISESPLDEMIEASSQLIDGAPEPTPSLDTFSQTVQVDQDGGRPFDRIRNGWGPSSAIYFFDFACKSFNVDNNHALLSSAGSTSRMPATSEWISSYSTDSNSPDKSSAVRYPPLQAAKELVQQYYISVEIFTPIIGTRSDDADLSSLYSSLRSSPHNSQLRSIFRAQMILAISLRIAVDVHPQEDSRDLSSQYALASDAIFSAAAANLRHVLTEPRRRSFSSGASYDALEKAEALEKIQSVLLLVVYLILSPDRGNVWQILGYAERLWRGIVRRDQHRPSLPDEESSHYQMLYESFVILELWVGTALGRPVESHDYDEVVSEGQSLPSLLRRILVLKARLHASYQAEETSGFDGLYERTPVDVKDIKLQAFEWLREYENCVEVSPSILSYSSATLKRWLLNFGCAMAEETILLAISLRWQETGFAATIRHPQPLDAETVKDEENLVISLLEHYNCLFETRENQNVSSEATQLICPFSWISGLDVFRALVAAAFISHASPSATLSSQIAATLKLLDRSRLFDGTFLAKAAFAINPT